MNIQPIKTRILNENDTIVDFIIEHIPKPAEKTVIAITSKIIAVAEGRIAEVKTTQEKERLIKKESEWATATRHVWLTLKDGLLMPSAGIDESNANGKLILLPKNSYRSAHLIRKSLQAKYNLKQLGIVVTDSRTYPLRAGVTGVALGYAGFRGLKDYRGESDIFGRPFVFSSTNISDSLASAAVLVMGEGNEQIPLALITKGPVEFVDKINKKELLIDKNDDMYFPLLTKLRWRFDS
jgi:F420-0:gamma-glutamyl ligase